MAYLIPPMDDEPPPEFVTFVSGRLAALRGETARLVGGYRHADEVYMEVLTDLAGHWRRLCWRSRLSHRDAMSDFLERRLATRTKQWREEQIYPVEVSVLGPPQIRPPNLPEAGRPAAAVATVAQQLAPLLPGTARAEVGVVAEAEIAWVHAYRRYVWRRYVRVIGGIVLLLGYLVQLMSQLSTPA
jgi:hypothetical protein